MFVALTPTPRMFVRGIIAGALPISRGTLVMTCWAKASSVLYISTFVRAVKERSCERQLNRDLPFNK
jgi:hypothetical protein